MKADRYDPGDLDAIRELMQSPGWALVVKRIREQIELGRDELERHSAAEVTFGEAQGRLKGFRVALAIPEILEDEIKGQL